VVSDNLLPVLNTLLQHPLDDGSIKPAALPPTIVTLVTGSKKPASTPMAANGTSPLLHTLHTLAAAAAAERLLLQCAQQAQQT
jgi:hypothetical protein